MLGERRDGEVGHACGFDDAALDEATEVDDQPFSLVAGTHDSKALSRLQRDDASGRKRGLLDVGGAVVEVVCDEDGARVLAHQTAWVSLPCPPWIE